MHARSTTFEASPDRIDAGIAYFLDEVMPALATMDGYVGMSLLTHRESGRCILTTAWDSSEAMQASAEAVRPIRDRLAAVFGGAYGKIKGGQHLKYPQDTPHANLLLTLLNRAGVPTQALGNSTGQFAEV